MLFDLVIVLVVVVCCNQLSIVIDLVEISKQYTSLSQSPSIEIDTYRHAILISVIDSINRLCIGNGSGDVGGNRTIGIRCD